MRNIAKILCLALGILPGLTVSLAAAQPGPMTYLHHDAFGNPMMATNAQGQVLWNERYWPFGAKRINQGSSQARIAFQSKEVDQETGLQYFGGRYYDPVVGRFTGMDPKGFGEANLQNFNRYAYANNNPYKYVDPDGRDVLIVVKRDTYTPRSIGGTLSVISDRVQNSFSGYTLENTIAGDFHNKRPIQPGIYDSFVRIDHSPNRIELRDVNDHDFIQFHNGNKPVEVKGCFLVGSDRRENWVSNSINSLNDILGIVEADQHATFGQGFITTIVVGSNLEPPLIIPNLGLSNSNLELPLIIPERGLGM